MPFNESSGRADNQQGRFVDFSEELTKKGEVMAMKFFATGTVLAIAVGAVLSAWAVLCWIKSLMGIPGFC